MVCQHRGRLHRADHRRDRRRHGRPRGRRRRGADPLVPGSFGRQQQTAGWEVVLRLGSCPATPSAWPARPWPCSRADPCPSRLTTTLILGGDQLALQVHESCGHPTELDRVFGSEAAYAGTSSSPPKNWATSATARELVNLTADSVRPLGLGTFGWDDEGVPATSTPLVKDGVFVGYLMSRETATPAGHAPTPACAPPAGTASRSSA